LTSRCCPVESSAIFLYPAEADDAQRYEADGDADDEEYHGTGNPIGTIILHKQDWRLVFFS